jgi:superfamily II DNA/RNA helicase
VTFSDLGVPADLVAALARQGIMEPMPVQIAAFPVLLAGKDAYLNTETGTGKTLGYLLPIFARIVTEPPATQTVIIAPTHELAIQIQRQCADLAQNAGRPIRTLLLIGGTAMERQIDKLKKRPHVVVGSPGRIRELIELRKLKVDALTTLVIDEADRLLMGESLTALRAIVRTAPATRQMVFASATEQHESADVITALSPKLVMLRGGAAAVNANIEHRFVVCEARDKPDLLRKLLHALQPERAMVFVHRNERAGEVASRLAHHKIPAADLHSASDKQARKQAMDDFRAARVRVLIASDLGARGLDIAGVTHVFNLDVPSESKAYLHRVGRTARAGAKGEAITLMTQDETRLVRRYERELGITMQQVRVREGQVIDAGPLPVASSQRLRPAKKRA